MKQTVPQPVRFPDVDRAAKRLERALDRQSERRALRRRFYDSDAIMEIYQTRRAR